MCVCVSVCACVCVSVCVSSKFVHLIYNETVVWQNICNIFCLYYKIFFHPRIPV
jgi:hypothetical protein